MGLLAFRLQGLLSLKNRDAVLEEDEAVERDEGMQAMAGAPGDPLHGRPKPPVLPFRRTGRYLVLHVSFGARRPR
jgi:hypothetical protein